MQNAAAQLQFPFSRSSMAMPDQAMLVQCTSQVREATVGVPLLY